MQTLSSKHDTPTWLLRLAAFTLLLCVASPAQAHRLAIFAYVEGDKVMAESKFGSGRPCLNCAVQLTHAQSGEVLQETSTDKNGACSFMLPQQAAEKPFDMTLSVATDGGHRGEWLIKAEEYAQKPTQQNTQASQTHDTKPTQKAQVSSDNSDDAQLDAAIAAAIISSDFAQNLGKPKEELLPKLSKLSAPGVDEATLRRVVSQVVSEEVEKQVAPIKHMLMQSKLAGPGPTEIAGGIGYLVGLAGLLAFFKSRRKDS